MKRVETQLEKILQRVKTQFLYRTRLNTIWKNINGVSTRFILKTRLYAINKIWTERVQPRSMLQRVWTHLPKGMRRIWTRFC
jgi:hypothetical protein